MPIKSIQDARYRLVIVALRERRDAVGMTQAELANALGRTQQFVSKYEGLERRLDVIEFVEIATALTLDWHSLLAKATA